MDQIKANIEDVCPQTVSCADIVVLAGRDAAHLVRPLFILAASHLITYIDIHLNQSINYYFMMLNQAGGPFFEVPTGRLDGLSSASITTTNQGLPRATATISDLISAVKQLGLNETDLVALSGISMLLSFQGLEFGFNFLMTLTDMRRNGRGTYGGDRTLRVIQQQPLPKAVIPPATQLCPEFARDMQQL